MPLKMCLPPSALMSFTLISVFWGFIWAWCKGGGCWCFLYLLHLGTSAENLEDLKLRSQSVGCKLLSLRILIVQDYSWLLEGSPHWQEHLAECSGILPFTDLHVSLICKVILISQVKVLKQQNVLTVKETPGNHPFPLSCYNRGDYFCLFLSIVLFPRVSLVPSHAVTLVSGTASQKWPRNSGCKL